MSNATLTCALAALSIPALSLAQAPTGPVRAAAEWEPAIGAQVRYPWGVPGSALVEIAAHGLLFVYTTSANQATAQAQLQSFGANMANVRWLVTGTSSHWTRDWGPSAVYHGAGNGGAGSYAIADHLFRGYSTSGFACGTINFFDTGSQWLLDDEAPAALAGSLGAARFVVPAYLVGGNFLVDGTGRAFYSCLLYEENRQRGVTQAAVDAAMGAYLGVSTRVVLPNFESSGIQHVDCAMKLVDEETVLVKRVPGGHPSFSATNQIASQLASTAAPSGRPYSVVRIDTPYSSGSATTNYTNSLILNSRVLMPAWGVAGDTAARGVFEAAMPGYTVVPLVWNQWYSNDALHCRARAVWDPGMLRLRHVRLSPPGAGAVAYTGLGHAVEAEVRPHSGAAVTSAEVRWRVAGSGGPWRVAALEATAASFQRRGVIPWQPSGTTVEYFIAASDASGRSETLPRTAPAWTYRFAVGSGGPGASCAANCDGSTGAPALNALDFSCFLSRFQAASALGAADQAASYANCDGSTSAPALNALDFGCFLGRYQQGCP